MSGVQVPVPATAAKCFDAAIRFTRSPSNTAVDEETSRVVASKPAATQMLTTAQNFECCGLPWATPADRGGVRGDSATARTNTAAPESERTVPEVVSTPRVLESSAPTTGGTGVQLDGEKNLSERYVVLEEKLLALNSALAEATIREQEWKKLLDWMKEKSERYVREAEMTKRQAEKLESVLKAVGVD